MVPEGLKDNVPENFTGLRHIALKMSISSKSSLYKLGSPYPAVYGVLKVGLTK